MNNERARQLWEQAARSGHAEAQMAKAGDLGTEFTRMASYGRVVPDLWMQHATGAPVSAEPLLTSAREALDHLQN